MKIPTIATLEAPEGWPFDSIVLNMVSIREGGDFVATVLEMDLQAVGASHEEAMSRVKEMLVAQVKFAIQKRRPELIHRHAEPHYWQAFYQARQRAISAMITGEASNDDSIRVGSLPLDQGVIASRPKAKPFQRHHAA